MMIINNWKTRRPTGTEFAPRVGGGHRRQAPNGRHTQQRRHGAHRLRR